jgi:hypothetical protein
MRLIFSQKGGMKKLVSITIPSPISMSDFGFGHHPARLAMAWHQWDSMMPVGRAMAKA